MNATSSGPAPSLPQRVHIIGISGVATSALAIAFQKAGVKVTGSDKGFFPPISTELERHGIPFYAGWHPEKMVADGIPDLVMTGGSGTSPSNPECVHAREKNIPVYSYAEVLQRYFIRKNSIVVAGTWGKTTASALLSFILLKAGMDPSYFTGGLSLSHDAGALSDSSWSVVEGDEYQAGISDKKPKFAYYQPTHLLLTAVSWDHADLYPTEESYFNAFEKLVQEMPKDGLIVANRDQKGVEKVLEGSKQKIVWYGTTGDYSFGQVKQTKDGLDLIIKHGKDEFKIASPLLGDFQAENITGCFAMAHEIGIPSEKIIAAIASFKGLKRRLEKRLDGTTAKSGVTIFDDIAHSPEKAASVLSNLRNIYDGQIIAAIASFKGLKRRLEKRLDGTTAKSGVTIFDDIAHSPEKAASVLSNLRNIYDGQIIAVFEPNIGGRERATASKYDNAFKDADAVIIPRLTKLKIAENVSEQPMEGDELAKTIGKTHPFAHYEESDEKAVTFLKTHVGPGDLIVFLGSHGFRGMIEETIKALS